MLEIRDWLKKNTFEIYDYLKVKKPKCSLVSREELEEAVDNLSSGKSKYSSFRFAKVDGVCVDIITTFYFDPFGFFLKDNSLLKTKKAAICMYKSGKGNSITFVGNGKGMKEVHSGEEYCKWVFEGISPYKYRYDVYKSGRLIEAIQGDNQVCVKDYFKYFGGVKIASTGGAYKDGVYQNTWSTEKDGKLHTFVVKRIVNHK